MTKENDNLSNDEYDNIDHQKIERLADEIASLPMDEFRVLCLTAFYTMQRKMHEEMILRAEEIVKKQKAEQKANRDGLTNLYGRDYFIEVTEDLLLKREPFAFGIIDLDRFKDVNDLLGHWPGDMVLALTAQGINNSFRTSTPERKGDTVARLGGDEFAFVQRGNEEVIDRLKKGYSLHYYSLKLEREIKSNIDIMMIKFVSRLMQPDGKNIIKCPMEKALEVIGKIEASVGMVLPTPYDSFDTLYTRSDKALYERKLSKKKSPKI